MKLNELKRKYIEILNKNNIINSILDVELIISYFTGINRLELNLYADDEVSNEIREKIKNFIQRRLKHEPIQYILGETEFYGLSIKVIPSVLIPRPETELLVEKIINESSKVDSILEIGTGSGCIAVALKKNIPKCQVTASDISKEALAEAQENANLNSVDIEFNHSDLFENISGKFDLIVSNPPYIPRREYKKLATEIRKFEPENALLAKEDGIYFYRRILEQAKKYLTDNGRIYFEIGYNEAERIRKIAFQNGFSKIDVFQDLNSFDRMMRIESFF